MKFFLHLASILIAGALVAGCDSGAGGESVETDSVLEEKARAIHERVLTLDTHVDIPLNYATEEVDPGTRGKFQVDLPKMREGGLDAAFFIVFVSQTERTPENYERAKTEAMTKFDAIHRMTEELYLDEIELAYSVEDVRRIQESGKLVALIGIENGYAIGRDISLLEKYYDLGARYMTLAHNGHNDIADSAQADEALGDAASEHNGIGDFGRAVIDEMNRLGIMVDVSHISKKAMMDATKYSRAPVMASHSSARALHDHPRNMDDEQLRAMKANNGVVQTVALGAFLAEIPPEKTAAIEALEAELGVDRIAVLTGETTEEQTAQYEKRMAEIDKQWPRPTVSDYVDHIDHLVAVMGIDHVGIASDFDGGGGIAGWDDASETFNVTLELVRRGYSEEEIAKIWHGNLLRVLGDAEKVAAEITAAESGEEAGEEAGE